MVNISFNGIQETQEENRCWINLCLVYIVVDFYTNCSSNKLAVTVVIIFKENLIKQWIKCIHTWINYFKLHLVKAKIRLINRNVFIYQVYTYI